MLANIDGPAPLKSSPSSTGSGDGGSEISSMISVSLAGLRASSSTAAGLKTCGASRLNLDELDLGRLRKDGGLRLFWSESRYDANSAVSSRTLRACWALSTGAVNVVGKEFSSQRFVYVDGATAVREQTSISHGFSFLVLSCRLHMQPITIYKEKKVAAHTVSVTHASMYKRAYGLPVTSRSKRERPIPRLARAVGRRYQARGGTIIVVACRRDIVCLGWVYVCPPPRKPRRGGHGNKRPGQEPVGAAVWGPVQVGKVCKEKKQWGSAGVSVVGV